MKNSHPQESSVVIEGIIVPCSWSLGNRVVEISLHTAGEREYLIDSENKPGKELRKLLGKRVKISGEYSHKESSPEKVTVSSYKIIDW